MSVVNVLKLFYVHMIHPSRLCVVQFNNLPVKSVFTAQIFF